MAHMPDTTADIALPAAEEALVEDRIATWAWFTKMLMGGGGVVILIVILMAIFLV